MGANFGMNPAAVLTDRRHSDAQRLTDGTATLAETNQSDKDNFPGNEPVFSREKTYAATRRTCRLATLRHCDSRNSLFCTSVKSTTSKASSMAPERLTPQTLA